ncbi:MAG: sensor histidine kinase [Isosphaeraceae bacterium]
MKIRVRSIFTKIVVWFSVTVVLSLVGFVATAVLLSERLSGRDPAIPRLHALLLDEARRAYEEGGPTRLASYLRRLKSYTEIDYYLTDSRGKDLVSGADRSAFLAMRSARPRNRRTRSWLFPILAFPARESSAVLVHGSGSRRYRMIAVLPPRPGLSTTDTLTYFLWLPVLIGILCYTLAVHLASPLRGLRRVLEKFGRGELGIRYHLNRRDEIGDLAQAFNRMADQITTLLTAERRLLQDVSHELRSPLARLGFAVELARTSPDQEAALGRIRKEGDRLSHLVNELLQLTRAEGDPGAWNLEDVDLVKLLQELVADCSLEADAQGCRLVLKADRTLVVTGDRELLRRACENVLRNAIRHSPAGTSVDIELTRQHGMAEVAIRDHGTGVPREALSDIFEPFFRVEGDRDRSSGGVGLGLAIARRAVEIHQGTVTAFNANPGLVVALHLPCPDDRSLAEGL